MKGINRLNGSKKIIIGVIILVSAVAGIGFYLKTTRSVNNNEESLEVKEIPVVTVKSLSEIVDKVTVEKTATIEAAVSAPLIARTGGRISRVNLNLGETVKPGDIIISVDGGVEGNPTRTQLAAAQASLVVFSAIEEQAIKAADNAIATAQLSVSAVESSRILTSAQVAEGKAQARLSVRQAELDFQDAVEAEARVDQVVRAADIRLQAAKIALQQSEIAEDLANRQTSDALKQAAQGLRSAAQAKDRIRTELQSQRVSLEGQIAVVAEQVRLSQVISPVSGQVTRLNVKEGEFVRAGQEIGEVMSFNGARITIDVTTSARGKLLVGQEVKIMARGQEFAGKIARLADGPGSGLALWQVDIFVAEKPKAVQPGDLVMIELPVGGIMESSLFVPLDIVTVRQGGMVIMTVDQQGIVNEHAVVPISYSGQYVEVAVDLPADAVVITGGNRTLVTGDRVSINS